MQLNSILTQTLLVLSSFVLDVHGAQICNNAEALCSRNYNNITQLGAHDSPFVRNATNDYTGAGDQIYTSLQQLDSGVRLLSAQVHMVMGNDSQVQWRLCHTLCQLYDAGFLVDWLKGIKGWLDANPNDVVTLLLVNSDNANASTLGSIYQQAGISQYSYTPPSTTTALAQWPTLSEMITQNKRLVNFIASLDPTTNTDAPYLLDEFTFVFENSYENILPTDFSCEPDRPTSLRNNIPEALSSNRLPLMNHFRYDNLTGGIEVPSVENLNVTNSPLVNEPGDLGLAANNCSAQYGRAPTFILTDFSNVGPAIETVDRLNGVSGMTSGRLALPDTMEGSMDDPNPTNSTSSSSMSGSGSMSMTTSKGTSTATKSTTTSASTTTSSSSSGSTSATSTSHSSSASTFNNPGISTNPLFWISGLVSLLYHTS